jgi:hypothetical protein
MLSLVSAAQEQAEEAAPAPTSVDRAARLSVAVDAMKSRVAATFEELAAALGAEA